MSFPRRENGMTLHGASHFVQYSVLAFMDEFSNQVSLIVYQNHSSSSVPKRIRGEEYNEW